MIFRKSGGLLVLFFAFLFLAVPCSSFAYQIFIYRPLLDEKPFFETKKLTVHGEFFGQLQLPSTFLSYNDLSGPEDRWNFGFQNILYLTPSTTFIAQLVTHDNGHQRTKFDWHFSLRQHLLENLVLIIDHDSNHDSDHTSVVNEKKFYLNRNAIGFGLPYEADSFYIEPFTRFFHHTNQKGHLDYSGENLRQEYGLRIGLWLKQQIGFHFQIFAQSEALFSLGQSFIADLIVRFRLLDYLELSVGTGLWQDIQESRLGNQKKFYKFIWGLAIPF